MDERRLTPDEALEAMSKCDYWNGRKSLGPTRISIIIEERDDGGVRVYSDDEPGLILSGTDRSQISAAIIPALDALRDQRK